MQVNILIRSDAEYRNSVSYKHNSYKHNSKQQSEGLQNVKILLDKSSQSLLSHIESRLLAYLELIIDYPYLEAKYFNSCLSNLKASNLVIVLHSAHYAESTESVPLYTKRTSVKLTHTFDLVVVSIPIHPHI